MSVKRRRTPPGGEESHLPLRAQSCACTLENYLTAEKEPNVYCSRSLKLLRSARGSVLVSAVSEALFKWEALIHRKGSESDTFKVAPLEAE